MAKFLDQDGTSYLVQSLISKTKTLNGQNIWNLDPNTQLHNPGNLNTSQLAIFPLQSAVIPFKESQNAQFEQRIVSWANSASMFQIDTPTGYSNTNLGSLQWLIMNYLACTSVNIYSPNFVMFGFRVMEMGVYLTGSVSSFIYKYLLIDKIFNIGVNIVLSGRISDLATSTSTTSTETTNGRFYITLTVVGSGSSASCQGAQWRYVQDKEVVDPVVYNLTTLINTFNTSNTSSTYLNFANKMATRTVFNNQNDFDWTTQTISNTKWETLKNCVETGNPLRITGYINQNIGPKFDPWIGTPATQSSALMSSPQYMYLDLVGGMYQQTDDEEIDLSDLGLIIPSGYEVTSTNEFLILYFAYPSQIGLTYTKGSQTRPQLPSSIGDRTSGLGTLFIQRCAVHIPSGSPAAGVFDPKATYVCAWIPPVTN